MKFLVQLLMVLESVELEILYSYFS